VAVPIRSRPCARPPSTPPAGRPRAAPPIEPIVAAAAQEEVRRSTCLVVPRDGAQRGSKPLRNREEGPGGGVPCLPRGRKGTEGFGGRSRHRGVWRAIQTPRGLVGDPDTEGFGGQSRHRRAGGHRGPRIPPPCGSRRPPGHSDSVPSPTSWTWRGGGDPFQTAGCEASVSTSRPRRIKRFWRIRAVNPQTRRRPTW